MYEIREMLFYEATIKNIELTVELEGEIPDIIVSDQ